MNSLQVPQRFTVDEFLAWSARQPKGRYELFDGKVIMQQSERFVHAELKTRLVIACHRAIQAAGVPYFVVADGPMVRIDATRAFQPDLLIASLPKPERNSLEISNPFAIIEVLSPSTAKRDLADKLAGYFSLPAVQHYLIVDPDDETILWHRREAGGGIAVPAVIGAGSLRLDPTGIALDYSAVFPKDP